MRLAIDRIDAFAAEVFKGNPAAAVPLDSWLPAATMQAIAAENNLSETAFLVAEGAAYGCCDFVSRFFAPKALIAADPVTGSAHCTLIPYGSKRLGKKRLLARQRSAPKTRDRSKRAQEAGGGARAGIARVGGTSTARRSRPMPSDYARIERALAYLAEEMNEQPALERLADRIGLSPFHFQRLFTRWVGISPKKFLQYLTLDRAKACLAASASVLEAAHDSGLSGPGRLHDLFIAHEAVTPGEFKRRGAGLAIAYGHADSPFGEALILTSRRGICGLAFVGAAGRAATLDNMTRRWPRARFVADDEAVRRLGRAIFAPQRGKPEKLRLVLHGSPFQIAVWEALLRIPPGALISYESLAARLGRPAAARAVGSAVADNPISYLIPCHRVIRKSGAIGDYEWGRPRKLALIGWEAAAAEQRVAAAVNG
ncbi:MAG: methylated-DNA--[protein]-cysteine S-methyltransferase [Pseudomonadota bacterium]